jgi:short-subunit dehydrogenase
MSRNGKLAVVTGGSKGIGRAVLLDFAGLGFDVATCSRSEEALSVLERDVLAQSPDVSLHPFRADLSDRREVDAFAAYILSLNLPVEVLVNNAGIFMPGSVHGEEEGNLELIMSTNLYSAYHLTRALLPGMMAARTGHIFNMCSTASIIPYVNGGSYCISKYALYGMTKVLREEMKEYGIRVTAVLPGATLTESWSGTDLPPERFMKAEDVSDVLKATYLLSRHSVVEEVLLRPQLGDI